MTTCVSNTIITPSIRKSNSSSRTRKEDLRKDLKDFKDRKDLKDHRCNRRVAQANALHLERSRTRRRCSRH